MAPPPVQIKTKTPKKPEQKTTELTDEAKQQMSEGEVILWLFLLGSSSVITLIADTVGLTGIGLIATVVLDVYPGIVNTAYSIRLVMLGQFSFIDGLLALASIVVPGSTLFRFLSKLKSAKDALETAKAKLKNPTSSVTPKATSLNVGSLKAAAGQVANKKNIVSGRTQQLQPRAVTTTTPQTVTEIQENRPQNEPTQQIQYITNEGVTTENTQSPQQQISEKEGQQEEGKPDNALLTDAAGFYLSPETGKEYAQLITTDSEQVKKSEITNTTPSTSPKPNPTAIATQGRLAQKRNEVGKEEDRKIEALTQTQNQTFGQSVPVAPQTTTPDTFVSPSQQEDAKPQKEVVRPTAKAPQINPVTSPETTPNTATGITVNPINAVEPQERVKPKTSEVPFVQIPEAPKESTGIFAPLEQFAKPPTASQIPQTYISKEAPSPIAPYPTYEQVTPIQETPPPHTGSQTVHINLPGEESQSEPESEYPQYPLPTPENQQPEANTSQARAQTQVGKVTRQQAAGTQTTEKPERETPDIFKSIEEELIGTKESEVKKKEEEEQDAATLKTTQGTSQNILDLRERFKRNKSAQRAAEAAQAPEETKNEQEKTIQHIPKDAETSPVSVVESIENHRQELQKQKNLDAQKQREIRAKEAEKKYRTIIGLEPDATQDADTNNKDQESRKAA